MPLDIWNLISRLCCHHLGLHCLLSPTTTPPLELFLSCRRPAQIISSGYGPRILTKGTPVDNLGVPINNLGMPIDFCANLHCFGSILAGGQLRH
jgi:hypothetical protein